MLVFFGLRLLVNRGACLRDSSSKAQAGLANVIIQAATHRRVQVLLESHSEHLLLQLQRRIAEEEISSTNVLANVVSSHWIRPACAIARRIDIYRTGPKKPATDLLTRIEATPDLAPIAPMFRALVEGDPADCPDRQVIQGMA